MILPYTDINLWASETEKKSFRPIHHFPIYTNTGSKRFLGHLTLPISIFRYELHTDTDFLGNTDTNYTYYYRSNPMLNPGTQNPGHGSIDMVEFQ